MMICMKIPERQPKGSFQGKYIIPHPTPIHIYVCVCIYIRFQRTCGFNVYSRNCIFIFEEWNLKLLKDKRIYEIESKTGRQSKGIIYQGYILHMMMTYAWYAKHDSCVHSFIHTEIKRLVINVTKRQWKNWPRGDKIKLLKYEYQRDRYMMYNLM